MQRNPFWEKTGYKLSDLAPLALIDGWMMARGRGRGELRALCACAVCLFLLVTLVLLQLTSWRAQLNSLPPGLVTGSNDRGLPHRHLLMSTTSPRSPSPPQTPSLLTPPPITSYIRLEGVDSSGNDLFVMYGASVSQMKAVCSALPDCEGFNSEGWMKSRISQKKRSTIDLYLKQVVLSGPSSQVVGDSGAGAFQNLLEEYSNMEQQLKIFIYPTGVGTDMPSYVDYKYGVEYLFISLLSTSRFRTEDPSEATFYFLPSRCTAYRKSVSDLREGIRVAGETMRRMVQDVSHRYPYWNLSLGIDHFYVCAHDMGTEVAQLADSALWKNAVGVVNTADASEPSYVPHKDISVPPHPGRGRVDWALIGGGGATFDPAHRTKLAFLAGEGSRGVRPAIFSYFKDDLDFHLVSGYLSDEDYQIALKTTKFCLCARGNKAWSPRLMDALWFGCIPVLIADHYIPPLTDLLDWGNISVVVPETKVKDLKGTLRSIPEERQQEMRQNILHVYRHLTWNDPPRPFDAFHSTLFQLWTKRHTFRTRPRALA